MKHFYSFLILLTGLFVMVSCASSGSASSDNNRSGGNEVLVDNPNLGLEVYINRLSGVNVRGSGQSSSIDIRGGSSTIESDPRPLFVIDGIRVGRDFSRVYRLVDMHNVNSVRVLKMSRATILYGHEGSNGVIEILTNNSS